MTTTTSVRYRLSPAARETIKHLPYWMPHADGVTIAGYVRYWYPDGAWRGDVCGCPDDRCIGYHHDEDEDCGCLPVTLGEYAQTVGAT
jgi:hypothetical protein